MKVGLVRCPGMAARWRWVVAVLTVVTSTLLLEGVAAAEYSEQQRLTQSDGAKNDYFGESVALSDDGNTAIVGLVDEDDNYQCADNTDGDHHQRKGRKPNG